LKKSEVEGLRLGGEVWIEALAFKADSLTCASKGVKVMKFMSMEQHALKNVNSC
jgi:hypothetical protein